MKNSLEYLGIIFLIVGFTSCNCCKTITKTQKQKPVELIKPAPSEESVSVLPYIIDSVWVDHLLLHIDLTYTGHKTEVGFNLIFNGTWLKSYPAKANLKIIPTVATTKGSKKVNHHLTFDLTPIKSGNSCFEVYVVGYKKGFRIDEEVGGGE